MQWNLFSKATRKQPSHFLVWGTLLKHKVQYWLPPFQNWHFFNINCSQQEASPPQKPSLSSNTLLWNWGLVFLLPVAWFFSRYVYTETLGQLWPQIPKDAIPQTPQRWTVEWLKSLKPETWEVTTLMDRNLECCIPETVISVNEKAKARGRKAEFGQRDWSYTTVKTLKARGRLQNPSQPFQFSAFISDPTGHTAQQYIHAGLVIRNSSSSGCLSCLLGTERSL